jgi:phenylpropionate dioxygenase-like ring-hydroxylating dioxygenase large terminal subunit
MLSEKDNNLLARTGPGTPAGKLLRSYWQPIATVEEMMPDAAPLPIRIMNEDLVLFRDDQNRMGLIGLHCAHRGTDLSYGRIENGGLRCLYHGWLFDIHGKCLDQPAEPDDKKFCHKVRQTSYLVQEKGGVIWTYMGEGEPPLIPDLAFLAAPESQRMAFRVIQDCNWVQGLESSVDPAHTSFLHRMTGPSVAREGADNSLLSGDVNPKLSVERTSFGTRMHSLRTLPNGKRYLRITNYVYPNGTTPVGAEPPPVHGYQGRWYVPMDDTHHMRFEFFLRYEGALDKAELARSRAQHIAPDMRHIRRAENRYLQDRAEMKRDETFAGLGRYVPGHDVFAIETQGAIQDRTLEHLGSTDIAIIEMRRALIQAIKQMDEGKEAPGLLRDATANKFPDFICTADYLDEGVDGPEYCRRVLSGTAAAE